jgi:hypothetical protein
MTMMIDDDNRDGVGDGDGDNGGGKTMERSLWVLRLFSLLLVAAAASRG